MADLEFYWGVMGSGKSTQLLQTVYDYRKNNKNVLVCKPLEDTKGGNLISSRLGSGAIDIKADLLIDTQKCDKENMLFDEISKILNEQKTNKFVAIFIDEAQFLSEHHIFDLMKIVTYFGIDVKAYGLRSKFDGKPFEGSSMFFANATKVERITTDALCRLSQEPRKATANLRLVDGLPTFVGNDVAIDNVGDVTYLPVCIEEWVEARRLYE